MAGSMPVIVTLVLGGWSICAASTKESQRAVVDCLQDLLIDNMLSGGAYMPPHTTVHRMVICAGRCLERLRSEPRGPPPPGRGVDKKRCDLR